MAAETFLFNFNESRFFLTESRKEKLFKKVCTVSYPPCDHLKIIDSLHRGHDISMALTPQRPNTLFGSNMCKCIFLPEEKKQSKKRDKKKRKGKNDEAEDSETEQELAAVCDEDTVYQTDKEAFSDIECSQEERESNKSKKSTSKKRSSSPRKSKSAHGGSTERDLQLEEIKCMLKKLLGDTNSEPEGRKRTSPQRSCRFIADECRKCSQKICLRCKMHLDSCCCGIPNFLFCKDCEMKYRAPDCTNKKDPFACRKCDQKVCLVCKQPLESCPCPKPNFLFCRMCDARMRTRCCIPDSS